MNFKTNPRLLFTMTFKLKNDTFKIRYFSLIIESVLAGVCKIKPDFYSVHPDFSRLHHVLIFLGYSLDFKLPPFKNPGRSLPKKISDSTLEKSGCRLNGRVCYV